MNGPLVCIKNLSPEMLLYHHPQAIAAGEFSSHLLHLALGIQETRVGLVFF